MKTGRKILVTSIGDISAKGNRTIGVIVRKGFAKKPAYILSDPEGINDLVSTLELDDPDKLIGSDISSLVEDFEEVVSTFVGDDGQERSTLWLQP